MSEIPNTSSSILRPDVLLLEKNSLVGSADVICDEPLFDIAFFSADCLEPELECSCCNFCCADADPGCNDFEWYANLDQTWEANYGRNNFQFGETPFVFDYNTFRRDLLGNPGVPQDLPK